jgi:hypothetical protein
LESYYLCFWQMTSSWDLRSAGILRSVWWQFLADVSGQPVSSIFKGQEVLLGRVALGLIFKALIFTGFPSRRHNFVCGCGVTECVCESHFFSMVTDFPLLPRSWLRYILISMVVIELRLYVRQKPDFHGVIPRSWHFTPPHLTVPCLELGQVEFYLCKPYRHTGRWGVTQLTLNCGPSWAWVVRFPPRSLYPEEIFRAPISWEPKWAHIWSGSFGVNIKLFADAGNWIAINLDANQ